MTPMRSAGSLRSQKACSLHTGWLRCPMRVELDEVAASAVVRRCRPLSGANRRHPLPAGCPQAILRPVPMISEPASDLHFPCGR
jgi:hypothetical protein